MDRDRDRCISSGKALALASLSGASTLIFIFFNLFPYFSNNSITLLTFLACGHFRSITTSSRQGITKPGSTWQSTTQSWGATRSSRLFNKDPVTNSHEARPAVVNGQATTSSSTPSASQCSPEFVGQLGCWKASYGNSSTLSKSWTQLHDATSLVLLNVFDNAIR